MDVTDSQPGLGSNTQDGGPVAGPGRGASIIFSVLGLGIGLEVLVWSRVMADAYPTLNSPWLTNGGFFILSITLIGVGRGLGSWAWGEGYGATLVAIGPVIPFLAAMVIMFLYVREGSGAHADPVLLGVTVGLAAWVLAVPPLMWLARADTAQTRSYGELVQRTSRAARRLTWMGETDSDSATTGLFVQAQGYLELLHRELGIDGLPASGFRYANATGYINLWRALHRLEESLIPLLPRPETFAAAMYDALRIEHLPNGPKLIEKLNRALSAFGDATTAICTPATPAAAGSGSEMTALTVLMEVRHAINVDQDDIWERLVRQRNRLLRTVLVTSLVGLLLVGVAVAFKIPRESLASAAVFYLVGALIGLFARLRAENNAGPAVDDYGLFEARLLATLLLSGLASVVGVIIVNFAPEFLANTTTTALDLNMVFSIEHNSHGLLTAALFGLTPELLTGWLSKQSNDAMAQLANTNPATRP